MNIIKPLYTACSPSEHHSVNTKSKRKEFPLRIIMSEPDCNPIHNSDLMVTAT